jgi:hypothetical protein
MHALQFFHRKMGANNSVSRADEKTLYECNELQPKVTKEYAYLFSHVPMCIYPIIESFTSAETLRNLLNANRKIFAEIKKEVIYFSLNRCYSLKYWEDESFRSDIAGRLLTSGRQVSLDLSFVTHELFFSFPVPDVHKVTIQKLCISDLSPFQNNFDLRIDGFPMLASAQHLQKIEKLKLINLPHLTAIEYFPYLQEIYLVNCPEITDLTTVAHVPLIYLDYCNRLTDMNMCGENQILVSISHCSSLVDMKGLGKVKKLELYYCDGIIDVSPLSNVFNLSIVNCDNVNDYSSLSNNCHLLLRTRFIFFFPALHSGKHFTFHTVNIKDLSPFSSSAETLRLISCYEIDLFDQPRFQKLKVLELRNCSSISDVNCLAAVQSLYSLIIDSCESVRDISKLGEIPVLKLDSCESLDSLDGLGISNQSVKISCCPRISYFEPLSSVPKVQIVSCSKFPVSTIPFLSRTNDRTRKTDLPPKLLFLDRLPQLVDVVHLDNLYFLKISYCPGLLSLNNACLKEIHTVFISYCENLEDITGLGKNYCVELQHCDQLKNIGALNSVPFLVVQNCRLLPSIYRS